MPFISVTHLEVEMRKSAKISVKGTKYYRAEELFQRGSLSPGTAIRLQHQPENPHDRNAVAVKIRKTGAMLGYLPKNLAPKYAAIITDGKIYEASLYKAEKNGNYIELDVHVVYDESDEVVLQRHNSILWLSGSGMPTEAGVYAIRSTESGRKYIGSSRNIKNRIISHIRDLSIGCHPNHALQSDFSRLGPDYFEITVLVEGISPSVLAAAEADQIRQSLNSGSALYNLTEDGQGSRKRSQSHARSDPISDRLSRERSEAERRRIERLFYAKKADIISEFDYKLKALIPRTNFLRYFIVAFFFANMALLMAVPKLEQATLVVVSMIFAFVALPLIGSHLKSEAKRKVQYQDLIKNRTKQLEEIENEHRRN